MAETTLDHIFVYSFVPKTKIQKRKMLFCSVACGEHCDIDFIEMEHIRVAVVVSRGIIFKFCVFNLNQLVGVGLKIAWHTDRWFMVKHGMRAVGRRCIPVISTQVNRVIRLTGFGGPIENMDLPDR